MLVIDVNNKKKFEIIKIIFSINYKLVKLLF